MWKNDSYAKQLVEIKWIIKFDENSTEFLTLKILIIEKILSKFSFFFGNFQSLKEYEKIKLNRGGIYCDNQKCFHYLTMNR